MHALFSSFKMPYMFWACVSLCLLIIHSVFGIMVHHVKYTYHHELSRNMKTLQMLASAPGLWGCWANVLSHNFERTKKIAFRMNFNDAIPWTFGAFCRVHRMYLTFDICAKMLHLHCSAAHRIALAFYCRQHTNYLPLL